MKRIDGIYRKPKELAKKVDEASLEFLKKKLDKIEQENWKKVPYDLTPQPPCLIREFYRNPLNKGKVAYISCSCPSCSPRMFMLN